MQSPNININNEFMGLSLKNDNFKLNKPSRKSSVIQDVNEIIYENINK